MTLVAGRFIGDQPGDVGIAGVRFEVRGPKGEVVGSNKTLERAWGNASDYSEYHAGKTVVVAVTPDGDVKMSESEGGGTRLTRAAAAFGKGAN